MAGQCLGSLGFQTPDCDKPKGDLSEASRAFSIIADPGYRTLSKPRRRGVLETPPDPDLPCNLLILRGSVSTCATRPGEQ